MAAPVVAALAILAAFVGSVATLGGAVGAQNEGATVALAGLILQASEACVVTGPVPGLSPEQAVDAQQIVSTSLAAAAGDQRVAAIALMVADTESGLHNLGAEPGNDGSLGLFQQRSIEGWGTPAQELNPAAATGMFVQRLLAVPGWGALAPWVAAQNVQRSAFDGNPSPANGGSSVVGGNYKANWTIAGRLVTEVLGDGNAPGSCGQGVPGGVTGPPSAHGLPVGYTVPAATGHLHARVVAYVIAQLGKPYVWGAAGPDTFDCSGLTQAAWATVGVPLLHYTVDQQNEGLAVTPAQLAAGDLVLIPGSDSPGPGLAGHVGVYLGYGLVASAIDPQDGIAVQSWQTFVSGGLTALRNPAPTDT
jgi:cell wall-associated NlpC family hydrolase